MSLAPYRATPLPWLDDDWQRLRVAVAEKRLHHAVLLGGPAGIGKRLLAELLARSLLCRSAAGGVACGECRDCTLFEAGSHPDLLRVVAEEPGRQIRIEQIRSGLAEFVVRTASISTAKVVLVDPADAMNTHTANSLLKSLEEPAPGTHIVLLSDVPMRLLPTVRSRCLQLRLRPPSIEAAARWLAEAGADEDVATDLLGLAAGMPLAAVRLRDGDGLVRFDRLLGVLRRAARPDAWIDELAAECKGLELVEVLDWIFLCLLDLAGMLARGGSGQVRIPRALPFYRELLPVLGAARVARLMQRVVAARRAALSTANPNPALLLEALLYDWQN